jgi:hypothetical protein
MYCPNCGFGQPDHHRFCISCGLPLPHDLLPARGPKITGLFPGIPTHWDDPAEPVLRVSRYLQDREVEGPGGRVVIPGPLRPVLHLGPRSASLRDELAPRTILGCASARWRSSAQSIAQLTVAKQTIGSMASRRADQDESRPGGFEVHQVDDGGRSFGSRIMEDGQVGEAASSVWRLVRRAGLEPATRCLEGSRSVH